MVFKKQHMVRFKGMVLNQKTRLVFFYYFSNKNTKLHNVLFGRRSLTSA
uniref:Uncharacterized protein n=2 Tax=Anguilla anguilla TaxID=7936 RepID=A0A0E9SX78_ANGAN